MVTQAVSTLNEATRARIDSLTQYFLTHGVSDQAEATHRSIVAIGQIVRRQAYVMAYSDAFYLLGVVLLIALVAALLLRKPQLTEAAAVH